MLSLGTAYVTYRVRGEGGDAPHSSGMGLLPLRGPYPAGGMYELLVVSNAGPLLEWVRGLFPAGTSWESIFQAALDNPPGAGGVRCYPDAGPAATPVLTGLHPGCDAPVLARAALEGLAFEVRRQFECLAVGDGVWVTGGGARNAQWVQLLADVTGRSLKRIEQPHIGLWDTARCALASLGRALTTSVEPPCGEGGIGEHRPGANADRRRYDDLYAEWLQTAPYSSRP